MRLAALFGVGVLCSLASVASAGPDWVERGDAGSTLPGAQPTTGAGQLRSITGTLSTSLSNPDLEDMYLISVDQPTEFRFDLTGVPFNTQVFIFRIVESKGSQLAFGLLGNDDGLVGGKRVPGSLIDGPANDGSGARITEAGIYALAITGAGRRPVSFAGSIFNILSPTEISGPDGPGGDAFHLGWEGEGVTGGYVIFAEGVGFSQVPAPGGVVALVGGMALLTRRRRGASA